MRRLTFDFYRRSALRASPPMPSKTWTRGDATAAPSTTTDAANPKLNASSAAPAKRKTTWERGVDSTNAPTGTKAVPTTTSATKRPRRSVDGAASKPPAKASLNATAAPFEPKRALEAKLKAVEEEKAKLRAAIEAQKRKVEDARAAKEKKDADARDKAERVKRAGNLLSGFRGVRKAVEEREEKLAPQAEQLSAAEIERRAVQRVVLAGSDWAILDLPPGSQKKWIKKSYMELAKILHPDKCQAPGAKEAFQKLSKAYRALSSSD